MSGFELQELKLVIVREPEPGSPLNKIRDQVVSFQTSGEALTEFISKNFCQPSNRFDVILVPIGQTFYELKGQLYQHRQKWALENL